MDDEKEDSEVSSNRKDVSFSDDTTVSLTSDSDSVHHLQPQVANTTSCEDPSRRQFVEEQTLPNIYSKTFHISGARNVVLGDQVVKTTKTDGRASNIKVSTRSRINSVDWRVYVETRAEKRGVTLLKKNGVVIVVGCPGSGKTTLALSMMRQIEKEEERESYLLIHEYEFNDIPLSRNKKCVVLIDDIFGKTNLNSDFMSSWQLKFPVVWSLVQDGSVKCIITLRNQIFAKSKTSLKEFELFNETHLLDLQSDDCCLLHDEKKKILNKYLEKNKMEMDLIDKDTVIVSSCAELGFPQVCVYYVNSSEAQKRGVEFFKKPVEYLTQQLENMKSDESLQINYLVLLLILFQQGSLSIDLLDPFEIGTDSDIMKLVRLLERVCQSVKNTDLTDIKKTADVMCGTYLNFYDNRYTFIHQSVFDCLFLMFSSEFPKKAAELLELCPISMLLEYVVTPGASNKSHITMTLKPDYFDFLAHRFADLLASSSAREIISHPSLKDEKFVKYMIEEKDFYGKWSEILNQKLNGIEHSCACEVDKNFLDIFEEIVHYHDSHSVSQTVSYQYLTVKEISINSSSVASECVANGLRMLSKCFTSNMCTMEFTDQRKELLNISCLSGNEDVVKILLQSGVLPTADTFSVAACSESDNVTILKELLCFEKEVKFNNCLQLLYLSIYSCNMNIACFLVDIINNEKDKSEIREKAVKLLLVRFHTHVRHVMSDKFIRKSLIDKEVDMSHLFKKLFTIEIINKIENIAVIAAGQRNSDVIKGIVKVKHDCLNDENRDEVLLAAAIWGSADTVNFLIDQRQNDTDENNWKRSQVLKVAVMFNNVDVVECLLDQGADPNANVAVNGTWIQWFNFVNKHCTYDVIQWSTKTRLHLLPSDSPLHISVLRGDLALLKSLVKRNADINAVNSNGKTPLHDAVIMKDSEHRKELVLFLLENGADVNITDKNKNSALHLAAEIGYVDVVTTMTEKGVNVNSFNSEGKTALSTAVKYKQNKVVLYLLEHGADPNLTDSDNSSVLHTAAEQGDVEIVTCPIEKGVM